VSKHIVKDLLLLTVNFPVHQYVEVFDGYHTNEGCSCAIVDTYNIKY
jgi:hypothetical protein